jgi:Flp pilus assembly protein TadG
MLLLMVGILDLGRAFQVYTTVANAAREGARYASFNPTDSTGIRAAIEQEADSSNVEMTSSSIIISTPSGLSAGNPIKITVSRPIDLIMGSFIGHSGLLISASSSMLIN